MNYRSKNHILSFVRLVFVVVLCVTIAVIIELDRAGGFNYGDTPFVIVFIVYSVVAWLMMLTSTVTFAASLLLLFLSGYWYIHAGTFVTTERFGTWFYLFFLYGLIQSSVDFLMDRKNEQNLPVQKTVAFFKIYYFFSFIYYKLIQFTECTSGKRQLFSAELLHVRNALLGSFRDMPTAGNLVEVQTIFGRYQFYGDLYAYNIVSPAFERQDKNYLLILINEAVQKGDVLFVDAGAYIGDYTVGIPYMIGSKKLTTIAFEPDSKYFQLCKENIQLNGIRNCTVQNVGLSNKTGTLKVDRFPLETSKAKVEYKFKKLDDIFSKSYYKKFNSIFIKIDNEGHEEQALRGAKNIITAGIPVYLMVEDAVDGSITRYLQTNGWKFKRKLSPFNSFWYRHE